MKIRFCNFQNQNIDLVSMESLKTKIHTLPECADKQPYDYIKKNFVLN